MPTLLFLLTLDWPLPLMWLPYTYLLLLLSLVAQASQAEQ